VYKPGGLYEKQPEIERKKGEKVEKANSIREVDWRGPIISILLTLNHGK